MVVAPRNQPRAGFRLFIRQDSQHAKDDGHACVERDALQAVRYAAGDVFKVHRLAFDEHTNGDDGVKGPGGRRGGCRRYIRCQVGGGAAEQVACRGAGAGGGGLHLGSGV